MVGAGEVESNLSRNDGKGSLQWLTENSSTKDSYSHLKTSTGAWVQRDDVFIWFLDRRGPLEPGYGSNQKKIGPELGFGWTVGEGFDEPVLLIKLAWGGKSLAECVAEKIGYRCIPRIAMHESALRYGVSEEELSEAISETPGIFERLSSERARYLACFRAALVREVKDDDVVYHGLAGHFLLKGVPHVLRVRVIANREFRIRGAMERTKLNRKEAFEYLRKADEKRIKWARFLYHVDWHDPSLFDLVINLDHMSLDSACNILCHTVSLDKFARPSNWQKIMEDLVLSTEVRAIVAMSKGITDSGIESSADGGIVTLAGTVGSLQDAEKIRKIAAAVPGVKDINSKMRVKSTW